MIDGLISLVSYGFYGGGVIGEMFAQWEQFGFFSYLLPFLLLFALIFGILNQIKLFQDNKSINAIIALSVGLMALQFDFVPVFFSEIFPRLGVGLAILLVLLILGGMFVDPSKGGIMYTLLGIGVVIAIIVLVNTAGAIGWYSGYWWYQNWQFVAGVVFILVVISIIVGASSSKSSTKYAPFWPYGHPNP